MNVSLIVDGHLRDIAIEPRRLLVHALREDMGITGPHVGCDSGRCGACTVLVDGQAVKSCMTLAVQADGAEITTAAGLSDTEIGGTLQEKFHKHHALQCGFCTPGMLCASMDLLKENATPDDDEIRQALRGNLCRCTGYQHIVEAVREAARELASVNSNATAGGFSNYSPENAEPPADTSNEGEWIGKPLPRMEDNRFLRGKGRYTDDIVLPNQLYAAFVRSPHAHAKILRINLSEAASADHVAGVYCVDQIAGLKDVPPNWVMPGSHVKGRPPLARGIVRHVGEAVAVVVATSPSAAADAADLIEAVYERLPVLSEKLQALAEDAPLVHSDFDNNIAATMAAGAGGFDKAAADADVVITMKVDNQRLVPFPIEPRAVNADFDSATGRLTFYSANQVPHTLRRMLANALDFPEHKLRIIAPDVGGGFGPKMHFYPEELLLAWISIQLGKPIKWAESRSENIVATTHGRDHFMTADIAANKDGKILALRVKGVANIGAYLSSMGTGVPTVNVALFLLGVYAIPTSEAHITCVYTNTTPVDAYRGAGRPEAAYLIERAIDRVALELNLDPADVRFANFVEPQMFPHRQGLGTTLDSGQYAATLQSALKKIDYLGFRQQQKKPRRDNKLLGIGISNYTETCGMGTGAILGFIGFDRGGFESALVRVQADGRVVVLSGSHSHGQGHVTTFAQIAADELSISPTDIEVIQGDTDLVPHGVGTFNSRSVAVGGSAVKVAAACVAARMRKIAGALLKCDEESIVVKNGVFSSRGGTGEVTVRAVAHAAWTGQGVPHDIGIGLEETEFYHPAAMSSPYGAHVAVVEIDKQTGEVALKRYVGVDDCGVIINPLLARGQVHGGLAQGIGQALFEAADIDEEGGPVSDPAIPRFDMLPFMETDHTISPTPTNPLGAKGIGEAGAIAAPPAIANAVIDALWALGVKEIDMPFTPERVLNAIKSAEGKRT